MKPEERGAFAQSLIKLGAAYGYSQRNPIPDEMIILYGDLLQGYSLAAVRHALHAHTLDPERGRFFPRPADIVSQIEGNHPLPDWILAIARRNTTPLGAMARLIIGNYDLERATDQRYLRCRAEEVIAQWPELKERALNGDYTDHELRVFAKYKIDPLGPVEVGLPRPVNPALPERARAAVEGPKFQRLIAAPEEQAKASAENSRKAARAARQQLSALIADIADREAEAEA